VDIELAHQLFLFFGKEFEKLYGSDAVTPNMHLHCHLSECMYDYGTISSFWLFSFERYNGIMASLPTSKHYIEIQLMHQFITHDKALALQFDLLDLPDSSSQCFFSDDTQNTHLSKSLSNLFLLSVTELSGITTWSMSDYGDFPRETTCVSDGIDAVDHSMLVDMYRTIYPSIPISSEDVSQTYDKCSCVSYRGDLYGCVKDTHTKSSSHV
jgi:hypothetical protein